MRFLLAAILAFMAAPAVAQQLPYSSTDTAISENFEFLANQFKKNSNSFTTGQIVFKDGTTQTTAGGSFAVLATTFTRYTGTESTTSTDWVTVSGTTVTLVMTGGRARMQFNCLLAALNPAGTCHAGFLVNGDYLDGETSTIGFAQLSNEDGGGASAASIGMSNWEHFTESTFSGSITFAPIYKASRTGGYQCHVNNGTSANNTAPQQICQMVVTEMGN